MLQLYYTIGSPPSRAVLHVIRLLGLDVNVNNLDLVEKKEQLTPAYLKINPMHQVPALVDGDFVITESSAIMTFLVNSRSPGSDLYPTDPKIRGTIDQRLYFDSINFFEVAASILVCETDFAGNRPTLADISILSTFIMFQNTFANYGELPNMQAWYERCQTMVGFDENVAGGKAIKDMMVSRGMSPISLK